MIINRNNLKYRQSTLAVIVNNDNKILLTQKKNYQENEWDFPGGGIEKNETDDQTILRELKEELGTDKFLIIKKSTRRDKYEWTDKEIEEKILKKGKSFRGQERSQFLVKFRGTTSDINIQQDELKKVKWVKAKDSFKYFIFPNQLIRSQELLKEFGLL